MSRRRFFTPPSNGSCSVFGSTISKRVHDRKFNGRCFCGFGVTLLQSGTAMNPGRWFVHSPKWKTSDCSYFVWVDEIEIQWEGLRRAFSERKMHNDILEAEDEAEIKMLMKLGKIEAEVSRLRLWLVTMSIIVVCNLVCNVYLIFSRF